MADDESVRVGVRVRPFNDREKKLNAHVCLEMVDQATTIHGQSEGDKAPREYTFSFDESLWTHDGFSEDANGKFVADPGSQYKDQLYVFNRFGIMVLDNAWAGFHCCLFAYGQTGAGKSYSMVGYGSNKGIVPMACEEIFRRIDGNNDANKRYEVTLSMVEIYNETIQDLSIMPGERPKKGLEIRESKMLGIYIEGVSKTAVESYTAISRAVDEANDHRSVGSTKMNNTSSRAHTVITIEFKSVEKILGEEAVKISMINLVDLAGSEKAGQTGAQGDTFKEGIAINSSLTALGNVIEKLAERSMAKTAKKAAQIMIPYRNSKLTRLLQNALGGSSKTIMICALSPASSNFEETLSTLRYADRAKKIKNCAAVNENPQQKLLRELKEENESLKEMMSQQGMTGTFSGEAPSADAIAEKQAEIEQVEKALKEMQRSWAEKLVEAKEKELQRRTSIRTKVTACHLANLNHDLQLSGKVRHMLLEGKATTIGCIGDDSDSDSDASGEDGKGSKSGEDTSDDEEDDAPDIILQAEGIVQKHAIVKNEDSSCTLKCPTKDGAMATFINGSRVADLMQKQKQKQEHDEEGTHEDGILLVHGDRVCFGSIATGKWEARSLFVYVDPVEGSMDLLVVSGRVTFEGAMEELITKGDEAPTYICVHCRERTSVTGDIKGVIGEKNVNISAKEEEMKAKDQIIAQLEKRLAEALDNQSKALSVINKVDRVDSMDGGPMEMIPSTPDGLARTIKKSFEDALEALDGMEKFVIGTGAPGPPVQIRKKSLVGGFEAY